VLKPKQNKETMPVHKWRKAY